MAVTVTVPRCRRAARCVRGTAAPPVDRAMLRSTVLGLPSAVKWVMLSDTIVIGFALAVAAGMVSLYVQWYRAGHRDRFLPW